MVWVGGGCDAQCNAYTPTALSRNRNTEFRERAPENKTGIGSRKQEGNIHTHQ